MHIINTCQLNFAFELPSVILPKRLIKFESAVLYCMLIRPIQCESKKSPPAACGFLTFLPALA